MTESNGRRPKQIPFAVQLVLNVELAINGSRVTITNFGTGDELASAQLSDLVAAEIKACGELADGPVVFENLIDEFERCTRMLQEALDTGGGD